jgi:hypothetical protein
MSGIPAGCTLTLRVTEVAEDRRARAACQRASFSVSAGRDVSEKHTGLIPKNHAERCGNMLKQIYHETPNKKPWISSHPPFTTENEPRNFSQGYCPS